jgi:2-polyprenyl-3-methyl-5-hydroxy-6-metoxy-1,4-benzoquinol methylase
MGKIFVNKEIEVTEGESASKLISEKNEIKFFEEHIGIKKIDKPRWLEAQYYERKTWCDSARSMITDRNEEHQKNFDNYKLLPSILRNDLSVIELGCGPYTNLRLILPSIKKSIDCIDLLDPLINDYMLNSPNCTYKNKILGFLYPVNIFNTTIEEFKNPRKYDLVVMINVLDHCFDVDLVFEKISNIMNEDGILLLGERVYKGKDLKESIENTYDAGHPIRISEEYFNNKLSLFKVLYSKEFISNNVIDKHLILQNKTICKL